MSLSVEPELPVSEGLSSASAATAAWLVAFATLFLQILFHRVVVAKLSNSYAFLVISLTLVGFSLSGVILVRWQALLQQWPREALVACGAGIVLTSLPITAIFCRTPLETLSLGHSYYVASLVLAFLYAIPFIFCGLALGLLLSLRNVLTRRVYGCDLLGSAMGALLVLPVMAWLGAEYAIVLVCAATMLGLLALMRPRHDAVRIFAALAVLCCIVAAVRADSWFYMTYPRGTALWKAQQPDTGYSIATIRWDPVARIELSHIPVPYVPTYAYPYLIGDDYRFATLFQYNFTQNNNSNTFALFYNGQPDSIDGIRRTIYSAAYEASSVPQPRVGIVGVGGGIDILTALNFRASSVDAIEANHATIDLLRHTYHDYFRQWVDDPRVHLMASEGRHYLSTHHDTYDVLEFSGVDSGSATPGASQMFVESYLYTQEAFDMYLSHLSEQGILNVMRTEWTPPCEVLRVLTTAVTSLRHAGVPHPQAHIMVILGMKDKVANFGGVLIKKTPFTPAEVQRMQRWASDTPYLELAAYPGHLGEAPNIYQFFLSLDDPAREAALIAGYPSDIEPVNDARPYFFHFSQWSHLLPGPLSSYRPPPIFEQVLLAIVGLTVVTAGLCIFLPLRFIAGPPPRLWRHACFYALIGLAYLGIEMAVLQIFALFLGHPNYSLSVVLAALLASSGAGALASGTVVGRLGGLGRLSALLVLVVLAERLLLYPVLNQFLTLSFPLCCLICIAAVAPMGFAMGMFFPVALQSLKQQHPSFVPWAWGINGIFSVLSPVLCLALATTWGSTAVLLAASVCYLLAGFCAPAVDSSAAAG